MGLLGGALGALGRSLVERRVALGCLWGPQALSSGLLRVSKGVFFVENVDQTDFIYEVLADL